MSRRGTITVGCAIVVVGAAIQASSFGVPQMIVARVITVIVHFEVARLNWPTGSGYRIYNSYRADVCL